MSEIGYLVSEASYLGHGSFEVSDAVSAYCLVGVDDGAPLSGEGSGAREVAAAEVPRDESDYGRVVHDMEHHVFLMMHDVSCSGTVMTIFRFFRFAGGLAYAGWW